MDKIKVMEGTPASKTNTLNPSSFDSFYSLLQVNKKDFKHFIESGTFMGCTVFAVHDYFPHIFTIEIAEHLYNYCIKKAKELKKTKIKFINDDSIGGLEKVKELIGVGQKCVFYLDGHYSGKLGVPKEDGTEFSQFKFLTEEAFQGNVSVSKNRRNKGRVVVETGTIVGKNVPLYDEISYIDKTFQNSCVIIIDDIHLFGEIYSHGNWTDVSLEGLFECIKKKKLIKAVRVCNRLLLHLE